MNRNENVIALKIQMEEDDVKGAANLDTGTSLCGEDPCGPSR